MSEGKLLRHFKVKVDEHWVVLEWAKHSEGPVRVAVLRSESGFAESPAEVFDEHPTQTLVHEGDEDSAQDQDVMPTVKYYYTCFARLEVDTWEKEHTDHVTIPKAVQWHRVDLGEGQTTKALDRLRLGLVFGGFGPGGGGGM